MYQLPDPPVSGIVVDGHGITWRRSTDDTWDPDCCPQCGVRPAGGLTWTQLLDQRGTLTESA